MSKIAWQRGGWESLKLERIPSWWFKTKEHFWRKLIQVVQYKKISIWHEMRKLLSGGCYVEVLQCFFMQTITLVRWAQNLAKSRQCTGAFLGLDELKLDMHCNDQKEGLKDDWTGISPKVAVKWFHGSSCAAQKWRSAANLTKWRPKHSVLCKGIGTRQIGQLT